MFPYTNIGLPASIMESMFRDGYKTCLRSLLLNITFKSSDRRQVLWYQGWGVKDGSQNFEFTWMNNVRNHGSIPFISWEPWDYTQGIHQPAYSLQNIIDGNFDSYITRWAQASKAWRHPYFLRFAHEMNANWYPWSELTNGNEPGQYIQAYRHVHDIFAAQGVKNVTWVWSPNVEYPGSLPLAGLYPGSAYVDWIGFGVRMGYQRCARECDCPRYVSHPYDRSHPPACRTHRC